MKDHWQTAETPKICMAGDVTEGINNPIGPLGVPCPINRVDYRAQYRYKPASA